MELITLSVGEKCPYKLPQEGFMIEMDPDGYINLYLNLRNIRKEELEQIQTGEVQYSLFYNGNTMFFCMKIGRMNWMDVAFHAGLYSDGGIKMNFPKINEETGRFAIRFLVVEASDNTIQHINVNTLSHEFSKKFLELAKQQYDNPVKYIDHAYHVQCVQEKYTSEKMATLGIIQCKAGD